MRSLTAIHGVILFLFAIAHGEEKALDLVIFESRVMEIDKQLTITITDKHLKESPKWDGVDLGKLPFSAKEAVIKARAYLDKIGCDNKHYYLMECAIVRENRRITGEEWYWKVVFGDNSHTMINVQALIAIPVLLNGKIPEAKMEKLKWASDEEDAE